MVRTCQALALLLCVSTPCLAAPAKKVEYVEVYQVWWTVPGKGMIFYGDSATKGSADNLAAKLRKYPRKPTVEVRGPVKRPKNDKRTPFSVVLWRQKTENNLVTGTIFVNGVSIGTFYENDSKKIPAGTYNGIIRTKSGKNHAQGPGGKMGNSGDFLLEIAGVPGRTDILFHAGNKAEQSLGCVLLGPVQTVNGEKIAPETLQQLRKLFFDGEDNPTMSPNKTITIEVKEVGYLSQRREVGVNGNAGTISGGAGDPGGQSYGLYQLTKNNVMGFVKKYYPDEFKGLKSGTKAFNDKWKEIFAKDPGGFANKQHEYIKETHYDISATKILQEQGLDLSKRSFTLQNVIWSTSVHHGPKTGVFAGAIDPLIKKKGSIDKVTDEEIIRAIYAERGRTNSKGELVYFSKVEALIKKGDKDAPGVKKGLIARFKEELQNALDALKLEQSIK